MARTSNAKILDWGTPPEPAPTGWDAVAAELDKKPGKWANLGEYSSALGRKVQTTRLPVADGYEHRIVPVDGKPNRVVVWVRKVAAEDTATIK